MLETESASNKAKVQGEGKGKPKKSSLGPWTNVSPEHLEKTVASLERYELGKKGSVLDVLKETNPDMVAHPEAHAPLAVAISVINAREAEAAKKKKKTK